VDILPVHPFRIIKVTADPGKHINVKFTSESHDNQPYYKLTIENKAKKATTYLEKVVVRTDSDIKPEFIIPVHGVIM
jgi:heat shock protein HspQ